MGLAVFKEDFDNIMPVAPVVDITSALKAVETLKEFERVIDKFARETKTWRAQTKENFITGLGRLEVKLAELSTDERSEIVSPMIDDILQTLNSAIEAYATPFHEKPEMADKMLRLSGGTGRYFRKQMNRVEDIRVLQYNTYIDLYYGLLAFRSENEIEDKSPSFDNAEDLGNYLRNLVA